MRGFLKFVFFILIVTFSVTFSFLNGYGTSFLLHPASQQPAPSPGLEMEKEEFTVFWEAWHVVQDRFYGAPVEPRQLTYGAIRGALAALNDPNIWFADPLQAERIRQDATGTYSGIGAVVNLNDIGRVIIVRPFAGGPADQAGLMAGDVVLQVDGTDTLGLTLDQAVNLIRGPEGTPVRLLIQREGVEDTLEVEVLRAEIEIPSVEYRMLEDGIAYLKLNDFREHTPARTKVALTELLAEEPRGLILDLRDNPGGLLSSSVEIASQFIAEGLILLERGSNGLEDQEMARGDGLATDIPLVVLVNSGTASASEIVAGAIRDHERGVLIGEHTFGKGTVQSPIDLSDGSHLRLTIAHWFTPDDQHIEEDGIAPDIEVILSDEDLAKGLDPQLEMAISYLLGE
jgi:carboxyl-terminal processing protease